MMGIQFRLNGVIYEATSLVLDVVTVGAPAPAPALVDLIPALTSGNSGGYVVTATSEYSEGGITASGWKMFNRVVTDGWEQAWNAGSVSMPQSVTLRTPAPIRIKEYTVQIRAGATTLRCDAWQLQGRMYGSSTWNTIDTVAGLVWSAGETKRFIVDNQGDYDEHRLYVTAAGVQAEIVEMRLYG